MPNLVRSIVAFWLFLGPTPASIGSERFGDIEVHAEFPRNRDLPHGYLEYWISVVNHSSVSAHEVTLIIPKDKASGHLRSISRSVVVGPSERMAVSLWQPSVRMMGENMTLAVDGEEQRDAVSMEITRDPFPTRRPVPEPLRLVSSSVGNEYRQGAINSKNLEWWRELIPFIASDPPISKWSEHWFTYSSFDGVVVTSGEWKEAPPAVKSALWRYVECGGSLFILGPGEVPSGWRGRTETQSGLSISYLGFGVQVSSGELDIDRLSADQLSILKKHWYQSYNPWRRRLDLEGANRVFPVVDNLDVPVRTLLLVMLLFVVVIGPVNILVLSRRRRRVWLLWTIPAVSAATCLAVSVTAVWSEGWTARVRSATLTVLDEDSQRAATLGWMAFYSPLTSGGGLHFSYDTELTPQIARDISGPGWRSLDWTRDQHLSAGWIQARVPAHFMIRRGEHRRERLGIQAQDGKLISVVNGLGSAIQTVWVADAEGRIYSAASVPAGAKAPLLPDRIAPNAAGTASALRATFASSWIESIEAVAAHPERFMLPHSYVALLDDTPFAEPGLPEKGTKRADRTLVYGILKGLGP